MIRKNYSFFSQFLFTASASRCWSECSCNWKPICCPHVGRRLVCQKSVMSSQRRKGKVCCGSVLAGSWAVYRWFQDQKHLPQVCCHTAVLWCDFISIHVNFEFGASCPVLLLDSPSDGLGGCFCSTVCEERGLDFWLLALSWISSVSWSERLVMGTSSWLRLLLAYPDQCFSGRPRWHLTIIHVSENCKTDN